MLKYLLPPYSHQLKELEDYWDAPARALFWEMRTGKTKAVIDSACALVRTNKIASLLVVAPNGPHDNWIRREMGKHATVDWVGHAWSSQNLKRKAHEQSVDRTLRAAKDPKTLAILAINKESLLSAPVVAAIKVLLRAGPMYLAVDESHHFGRPGAKRTNRIRALSKKCDYRRILTGKPTGNSPLKLFSQYEILKKGALGFTRYSDFKDRYSEWTTLVDRRSKRKFEKLMNYRNLDELRDKIAMYASTVLREDCEDLPEIINTREYYQPSTPQLKAYREIGKNYRTELQGIDIEVVSGGNRLSKLQQILSNYAIMPDGSVITVDLKKNPRADTLLAALVDCPKAVVWCQFVEDIRRLRQAFKDAGWPHVEYYGATPDDERARALDLFQEDPTVKIFIGQPSSGAGEGQDLSAADTTFWYSHTFNLVVRDQASARTSLPGKKSVSLVDMVASPGGVDNYILSNLENKRSVEERVTGTELHRILKECEI